MPPTRIDPKTRRRNGTPDGVPVTMADGQPWELALPMVRFAFDGGPAGMKPFLVLGDDFNDLIERREEAQAYASELAAMATDEERASYILAHPGRRTLQAADLAIGAALLRANYELSDAELGRILHVSSDPADAVAYGIWQAVLAVAYGNHPKPTGGGSPPP